MARRRKANRLNREQVKRALISWGAPGLLVVALALVSGAYSLARIVETARPELSLSLMPNLAPALAAKAEMVAVEAARGGARTTPGEIRRLAERSLRAAPLNPQAIRLLAVSSNRRIEDSRQLMAMSLRTSRRDVGTHLVQIELEVAGNNVAGALRHYDQALRVSPAIGPTLYPVLLGASDTASVLPAIRRLVSTDPPWLPRLVAWTIENPTHLAKLTRLVSAIPPDSEAMSLDFGPPIIEALVQQERYDAAYLNYRSYQRAMARIPERDRRPLRPFDWTSIDEFEAGSAPVSERANAFTLFADASGEGEVLYKLNRLPAGAYRFSYIVDNVEGSGAALRAQVSCAGSSRTGNLINALRPLARSRVSLDFTVPRQGCSYQWVRLHVRAGSQPLQAQLDRLSVTPLR